MDRNYEPIGMDRFYGGQSTDISIGSTAQFYNSHRVDFRKRPSSFTLLPQPTNSDGGIVKDLVTAMDKTNPGVIYASGDAGNCYMVSTAGVWSNIGNLGEAGGAGVLYRSDVDMAYITGQNKIARVNRTSTQNSMQQNWFPYGISTCTTCYKQGGLASYTVPIAIDESTTNRRSFTSDIEPLYRIGVDIISKGTGNWTLTLHDDANVVLAAVTVSNSTLNNNSTNYFTFSGPISIQRGDNGGGSALTYHFHLTSTVADGTIMTTTANSMADCDMELWAYALTTTVNTLHPTIQLSNQTLFGNGRYVAAYEPLQDNPTTADFNRHRITLPPGFEVCGFARKNLMVVIGAERRSPTGEVQEGMLFFWDGIADTYNDYWPVPEGSPEGLFDHKNVVWFIAGGALYRMRGGDQPIKVWTFRSTDSEYSGITDITHALPNVMTVRRGTLLIGYPSTTTNLSLEYGLYSWGSINNQYPESFGYNYSLSSGSTFNNGSNNLKIGLVKSYGDTLYTSWRDDSANPQQYSVDIVNNSSTAASSGDMEFLLFDNDQPSKYKQAGYMIATFEALPAGATVTLKYKIDDDSVWNYGEPVSTGTYAVSPIEKRFFRLQIGIDITATTATPEITSLFAWVDPLKSERPIGP